MWSFLGVYYVLRFNKLVENTILISSVFYNMILSNFKGSHLDIILIKC